MAPVSATAVSAGSYLLKRDLSVNHTQAVTLGVMAAYVVVIALLWNLPYVRWCLWPFKVSSTRVRGRFWSRRLLMRTLNRC